ncbi:hypothetical protein VA7868_04632 [Vibrio aerogenes CECT 7868]|uniref:Uncharacterized protein n=1 Tax=Vibrio aerogenes CECT 7868 TaxID=1216006 RepID=A0A1M6FDL7_9VIBR|nr:hypothetical protein [Vibrio aerogenes]SHI95729.1 hypothetical protein VA7868_04632 [Vibrio aerogenes CECT 7868]
MRLKKYIDLPSNLKSQIAEDKFLLAYQLTDSENIVIWVINDHVERRDELEFLPSENRFLSLDERKKRLPESEELNLSDMAVKVIVKYDFEPDTNVLYEYFDITSENSGLKMAEESRNFYSAYKPDSKKFIVQKLEKLNFPLKYQTFSVDEKINYWVEKMYRFRRQVGESGCEENDAFDVTLIDNMKKIDPDISDILPDCLKKLAQIEQINAVELAEAFEKRTGYQLG